MHRVLVDEVEERRELVDLVDWRARVAARSKRNPSTCISVDPVAQRVHDQLQDLRVAHQQVLPVPVVVEVVRGIVVDEPVVGGVVDAPEREGRPELVALGGVVVDDVQDDLDAGACRALTIALNSVTCRPRLPEEE